MAYRCPHYLCVAGTIEGLIQQISLSYLRHGYWWYVTGVIPEHKLPQEVDHNIVTKYGIRKDWRYIAHNKQRGIANMQYIRHGQFYVIMATNGLHEFKQREAKRIRDARRCPILVPRNLLVRPDSCQNKSSMQSRPPWNRVFDGYAVSYSRGKYLRKSAEEKAAHQAAMRRWEQQRELGKNNPKPPKGQVDPKWHACVAIEKKSYLRLRSYFLDIATQRSLQNLNFEFTQTGYVPYQPVKRQLVRIIKDVNHARNRAGCSDQLAYRTVLAMKRRQVHPFESGLDTQGNAASQSTAA